jgi:DNA-binding MarR family transcriptional regulator
MTLTAVRLAKVVELVVAGRELTVNQLRMLALVEEGEPPLAELSRRLAMKPPNVSVLIDGLAARGYVERERDPTDGRRRRLRLTVAGRGILHDAERACERAFEYLLARAGNPKRPIEGLAAWERILDEFAVDELRSRLRPAG